MFSLLLATLIIYPEYPKIIERDEAYAVRVTQGDRTERIPVYNHCEKSLLADRTWGGDVNRRFSAFAFDGDGVRVDIAVREDVKSYKVFPAAKRFRHAFKNGVISVYLDKPDYFGIQLNDLDKSILSVFADPPETDVPAKDKPNCLYVDGWLDAPGKDGVLPVGNDITEIYVAPGAVLNARVAITSKHKCKLIHGRGMVLDPMSNVFKYDQSLNSNRGLLSVGGHGIVVDGLTFVDSRTFTVCNWWGVGCKFRNIKELCSMMCSDGFSNGGRHVLVEHCWSYVGDNALVVSCVKSGVYRDLTLGTSCKAIFPQGTNEKVVMEDINVFRADEAIIANEYNGSHLPKNKWSEMGKGMKKKQPGPQDRQSQGEDFFFRRLCGVDQTLSRAFFLGRNMGVDKPKTFVFEDCSIPYSTGVCNWKYIGRTDGVAIDCHNDPRQWLISSNFVLTATNLWYGGKLVTKFPEALVRGKPGEVDINLVTAPTQAKMPLAADRVEVNWSCPEWKKVKLPLPPKNLLEETKPIHSIWQRCPSWMVKFEATGRDTDGSVLYHLIQCEKGGGISAVLTENFLAADNGNWKLGFNYKIKCENANPKFKIILRSNETIYDRKDIALAADGEWHHADFEFKTDFDLAKTGLVGLFIGTQQPTDDIVFKNFSFVKDR